MSMLDPRIAEMIQADVDGELPAAERAELESILAGSAEARRFREEMIQVASLMSGLPQVEPPAGLARRILQRLEASATARGRSMRRAWLRPTSYGLAMAAGVLIAISVDRFAPSGSDDVSRLVGSMMRQTTDVSRPSTGRLVIDVPGVQGEARMVTDDSVWTIEFDLETEQPVEIAFDLARSGTQFGGFADPAARVQEIDLAGGELSVMNHGSQRFVLFLRPVAGRETTAQAIPIAVRQGGETLFEGRLQSGG